MHLFCITSETYRLTDTYHYLIEQQNHRVVVGQMGSSGSYECTQATRLWILLAIQSSGVARDSSAYLSAGCDARPMPETSCILSSAQVSDCFHLVRALQKWGPVCDEGISSGESPLMSPWKTLAVRTIRFTSRLRNSKDMNMPFDSRHESFNLWSKKDLALAI
jgi:hypothetical protein